MSDTVVAQSDQPGGGPVTGQISKIKEGFLLGWLYDSRTPGESVRFRVRVNGEIVPEVFKANRFRQELADKGMGDGNHGFRLLLSGDDLFVGKNKIEILNIHGDMLLKKFVPVDKEDMGAPGQPAPAASPVTVRSVAVPPPSVADEADEEVEADTVGDVTDLVDQNVGTDSLQSGDVAPEASDLSDVDTPETVDTPVGVAVQWEDDADDSLDHDPDDPEPMQEALDDEPLDVNESDIDSAIDDAPAAFESDEADSGLDDVDIDLGVAEDEAHQEEIEPQDLDNAPLDDEGADLDLDPEELEPDLEVPGEDALDDEAGLDLDPEEPEPESGEVDDVALDDVPEDIGDEPFDDMADPDESDDDPDSEDETQAVVRAVAGSAVSDDLSALKAENAALTASLNTRFEEIARLTRLMEARERNGAAPAPATSTPAGDSICVLIKGLLNDAQAAQVHRLVHGAQQKARVGLYCDTPALITESRPVEKMAADPNLEVHRSTPRLGQSLCLVIEATPGLLLRALEPERILLKSDGTLDYEASASPSGLPLSFSTPQLSRHSADLAAIPLAQSLVLARTETPGWKQMAPKPYWYRTAPAVGGMGRLILLGAKWSEQDQADLAALAEELGRTPYLARAAAPEALTPAALAVVEPLKVENRATVIAAETFIADLLAQAQAARSGDYLDVCVRIGA